MVEIGRDFEVLLLIWRSTSGAFSVVSFANLMQAPQANLIDINIDINVLDALY